MSNETQQQEQSTPEATGLWGRIRSIASGAVERIREYGRSCVARAWEQGTRVLGAAFTVGVSGFYAGACLVSGALGILRGNFREGAHELAVQAPGCMICMIREALVLVGEVCWAPFVVLNPFTVLESARRTIVQWAAYGLTIGGIAFNAALALQAAYLAGAVGVGIEAAFALWAVGAYVTLLIQERRERQQWRQRYQERREEEERLWEQWVRSQPQTGEV